MSNTKNAKKRQRTDPEPEYLSAPRTPISGDKDDTDSIASGDTVLDSPTDYNYNSPFASGRRPITPATVTDNTSTAEKQLINQQTKDYTNYWTIYDKTRIDSVNDPIITNAKNEVVFDPETANQQEFFAFRSSEITQPFLDGRKTAYKKDPTTNFLSFYPVSYDSQRDVFQRIGSTTSDGSSGATSSSATSSITGFGSDLFGVRGAKGGRRRKNTKTKKLRKRSSKKNKKVKSKSRKSHKSHKSHKKSKNKSKKIKK